MWNNPAVTALAGVVIAGLMGLLSTFINARLTNSRDEAAYKRKRREEGHGHLKELIEETRRIEEWAQLWTMEGIRIPTQARKVGLEPAFARMSARAKEDSVPIAADPAIYLQPGLAPQLAAVEEAHTESRKAVVHFDALAELIPVFTTKSPELVAFSEERATNQSEVVRASRSIPLPPDHRAELARRADRVISTSSDLQRACRDLRASAIKLAQKNLAT